MGRLTIETRRHDASRATVNQGFPQVAFIEDDAAVDSGDAALVSPVLHPFTHPLVYPPGMQYARRQRLCVGWRRKTEDIGIEDEFCPQAGSEGVPVDPDDPRQGAAVWVKRRWGIVRFHLEDQVVIVVKFNDAGVIAEDGEAPVVFSQALPDFPGGALDIAVEEGVYQDGFAL